MNRSIFLVMWLLTLSLGYAHATTPAAKSDPVIGHWMWKGDENVMVNADGTAQGKNGFTGSWRFLGNKEIERKYEFQWTGGRGRIYIDSMRLIADGNKLEGHNQEKHRVWALRVPRG